MFPALPERPGTPWADVAGINLNVDGAVVPKLRHFIILDVGYIQIRHTVPGQPHLNGAALLRPTGRKNNHLPAGVVPFVDAVDHGFNGGTNGAVLGRFCQGSVEINGDDFGHDVSFWSQ